MDKKLELVLHDFERTVCSLNYNGYFTKAFTESFLHVLGMVAVFRQHYKNNNKKFDSKSLFHYYFLPKRDVVKVIKSVSNFHSISQYSKDIYQRLQTNHDNLLTHPQITIQSLDIDASIKLDVIPQQNRIKSKIEIPLIVKYSAVSEKRKKVYIVCSPTDNGCSNIEELCTKTSCKYRLCGVIEIYSSFTVSELRALIGDLKLGSKANITYLARLLNMFYIQEEPECYGSPPQESEQIKYPKLIAICNKCSVRDSCWVGYDPKSKTQESHEITQRMSVDEVIAQLFEKCSEIVAREVKSEIAFLRFRGSLRKFQYRGFQAMDLVVPEKAEITNTQRDLANRWKDSLLTKIVHKDTAIYQELEDITKDIYETESGELIFYAPLDFTDISFNNDSRLASNKIKDKIKYTFLNGTPKNQRLLFEELAFKYRVFIAMPVFHIGQLLGIIFVNFEPPTQIVKEKGQSINRITWSSSELQIFYTQFRKLAVDFGPALFHALTYDFISEIIKNYTTTHEQIHEIVLKSFMDLFDSSLCSFIPVSSEANGNNTTNSIPAINSDFISIKFKKEISKFILDSDIKSINTSPIELNNKTIDRLLHQYNLNRPVIVRLFKGEKDFLLDTSLDTVYSREGQKSCHPSKAINLKTVFVIPIKDNSLADVGFKQGLYLIFFERSNYIIQRHAIELLREISGVLNVVQFGERRQLDVLNHARRAAVGAIMGRNMSHNIGSHVLFYHQKNLVSGQSNLKNQNDFKNYFETRMKDEASFMEYLKTRMDFIANVCTVDPSWFYNMELYRDVLKPFFEQRILLNGIVLSEGICRHCDDCESGKDNNHALLVFTIKLINSNGKIKQKTTKLSNGKYELDDLNNVFEKNKIEIAMPHSIVGVHALYTIFENFIRNSAKHGKFIKLTDADRHKIEEKFLKYKLNNIPNLMSEIPDSGNNVTRDLLIRKLSDIFSTGYNKLADDYTRSMEKQAFINEVKNEIQKVTLNIIITVEEIEGDLIKLTISDGTTIDDFTEIDEAIESEMIDRKNATINFAGWGFKEQKIAANYLRLGKVAHIDNADYRPPDYYVPPDHDVDSGKLFGRKIKLQENNSVFYLLKPKLAYVVVRNADKIRSNNDSVTISNNEMFIKDSKNGIPHEFLIFEDKALQVECLKNRMITSLPQRILNTVNMLHIPGNKFDTPHVYGVERSILYEKWVSGILKDEHHKVEIIDNDGIDNRGDLSTYIFHDDHGSNIDKASKCLGYIPYRNGSSMSTFISKNKIDDELKEIALTRIYIADERIWSERDQPTDVCTTDKVTKKILWESMKIGLIEIKDNKLSVDEFKFNSEIILNDNLYKTITYVIVHQGLIDKLEKEERLVNGEYTSENIAYGNSINDLIRAEVNYVITSGRGALKPDQMKNARFLEFATLQSLLNCGDKLGLVKVLFSLRNAYIERSDGCQI